MIEGIKIIPKKQIIDERGKIMHMMRNDDENFTKFGEVYFSYANPSTVKAWHLHKKMTVNYAIMLSVKLNLYYLMIEMRVKPKVFCKKFFSNNRKLLFSDCYRQEFGMVSNQ